jgi:hypothetical protein
MERFFLAVTTSYPDYDIFLSRTGPQGGSKLRIAQLQYSSNTACLCTCTAMADCWIQPVFTPLLATLYELFAWTKSSGLSHCPVVQHHPRLVLVAEKER